MGKILILADLHFHTFQEFSTTVTHKPTGLPINSRLNDMLETVRDAFTRARKLGCTSFIIAGDVYHKRQSVPTEVRQFARELFEYAVKTLGMTGYVMTGNHDQLDRDGQIHTLYDLRGLVTVIDSTSTETIEGANVEFLPFMERTEDTIHCLSRACANDPVDLLVMHTGVEGAYVGSIEYRIKSPVTLAHIEPERFGWVILGHYHKGQQLARNVVYCGSPHQVNRAERGDKKRFLVFTPDTHSMRSYYTKSKEFRTITSSELLAGNLEDHYYDVEKDSFTTDDEVVAASIGKSVKILRAKVAKVSDKRIELTESMTDSQILQAYIAHKGANPKWLDFGLSLMSKVGSSSCPYTSMKLVSIVINNFMSIEYAKLLLNRPGRVIAVVGENNDNPGFDSNGAGKSAMLPESVFWCLYDETARNLPADKVVNRFEKRDCFVQLTLMMNSDKLVVTRFRKHKALGGTGLHLKLNGNDITMGTPELTEIELKRLIGMDYTTFSSIVAFSPDNLKFVASTDAKQKLVLDSILQTRRFSAALAVAKSLHSELKTSRLSFVNSENSTSELLVSMKETQDKYVQNNDQFAQRELERLSSIRSQIDSVINLKSEAYDHYEETVQELGNKEDALAALKAVCPNREDASKNYELAVEALANARAKHESDKSAVYSIQVDLRDSVDQAGKPCPTCGVPVTNTGKLIVNLQSGLRKAQKAVELSHRDYLRASENRERVRQDLESANKGVALVEGAEESIEKLKRVRDKFAGQVTSLSNQLLSLDLSKNAKPVNEYDRLIPELDLKIVTTQKILDDARLSKQKIDRQINLLNFWEVAFGNAGVRSFLLDQMLPDLTQFANEFSNSLTGGRTVIEIQSYNEDTMKDKFKIHAWNEDGSDIYAGNSSGEKRRVDVCVMFALLRVAITRTKINIALLDEILDTLDASGLDSILDTIQRFARELNLSIYVTSHTELNDMISEKIIIKKHKGRSVLIGA